MEIERTRIHGEDQTIVTSQLQEVVFTLIDLGLQGKQIHWNVVGPRFRSLHLQLDELVAKTREYSDAVAERMVMLGAPALGSSERVQQGTKLDPAPERFVQDSEAVKLFVERLSTAAGRIREAVALVEPRDPVSTDLLVRVLGGIEEQVWMFHAQAM